MLHLNLHLRQEDEDLLESCLSYLELNHCLLPCEYVVEEFEGFREDEMFFWEFEAYLQVFWESFFCIVGEILLDFSCYYIHFCERIAFHHSSVPFSITLLQFERTVNAEKFSFDEDSNPIAK